MAGLEVELKKIEHSNPSEIDPDHVQGLAFPVACQSTFLFIWDFLLGLPETDGTEVFMVDTLESFSGAIVGPLRRVLKKKGYRTIGAEEIVMPGNWFPRRLNEQKNEKRLARGLARAEKYAGELVEGSSRWRRIPVLSDVFYWFCSRSMTWDLMAAEGKKYRVDTESCNRCGYCTDLCPVGNIGMDEYPIFGGSCQQCMRCIAFCPTGSISIPGKQYELYRAVKLKDMLGEPTSGGT